MKTLVSKKKNKLELLARDVRPDSRKRVALGKALEGADEDVSYFVYGDAEGRIILEPQVTIPAREAWLYRNPKALAMVRRGIQQVAEGKTVTFKSFAAFIDAIES